MVYGRLLYVVTDKDGSFATVDMLVTGETMQDLSDAWDLILEQSELPIGGGYVWFADNPVSLSYMAIETSLEVFVEEDMKDTAVLDRVKYWMDVAKKAVEVIERENNR